MIDKDINDPPLVFHYNNMLSVANGHDKLCHRFIVSERQMFFFVYFFFPFLFVFFNLYVHNIGIGTPYISCLRMILQLLFLLMAKTFQRIRFQTVISIIIVESTFIYSIATYLVNYFWL